MPRDRRRPRRRRLSPSRPLFRSATSIVRATAAAVSAGEVLGVEYCAVLPASCLGGDTNRQQTYPRDLSAHVARYLLPVIQLHGELEAAGPRGKRQAPFLLGFLRALRRLHRPSLTPRRRRRRRRPLRVHVALYAACYVLSRRYRCELIAPPIEIEGTRLLVGGGCYVVIAMERK